MPNPHGLNPSGPTLQGIDVASPQGKKFDFVRAVEDGVSFAWIQVSGPASKYRERNWRACLEAGLLRGPYAFLSMITDGRAQGEQFLRAIEELGGYDGNDLHPMVDIESKAGNPSQQRVHDTIGAFLERVEEGLGRPVVIYTYPSYWREVVGSPRPHPFGQRPLWISHFKVNPETGAVYKLDEPLVPITWETWDIWQVTGNLPYEIAGVRVCADVFWGTREAFVRRFCVTKREDTGSTVPDAPLAIRHAESNAATAIRAGEGEKEYKP